MNSKSAIYENLQGDREALDSEKNSLSNFINSLPDSEKNKPFKDWKKPYLGQACIEAYKMHCASYNDHHKATAAAATIITHYLLENNIDFFDINLTFKNSCNDSYHTLNISFEKKKNNSVKNKLNSGLSLGEGLNNINTDINSVKHSNSLLKQNIHIISSIFDRVYEQVIKDKEKNSFVPRSYKDDHFGKEALLISGYIVNILNDMLTQPENNNKLSIETYNAYLVLGNRDIYNFDYQKTRKI